MSKELQPIIDKLENYKKELTEIRNKAHKYPRPQDYGFDRLDRHIDRLVEYITDNLTKDESERSKDIYHPLAISVFDNPFTSFDSKAQAHVVYLGALIEDLNSNPDEWLNKLASKLGVAVSENQKIQNSSLDQIVHLCNNFPSVVRQLKSRPRDREPLEINDEYDVQYLFHALLKIFFDDVRPEEWAPSYAGQSAKMDFLLKDEKIVIETKMTREKLSDGKIGDELLVDIDRYKEHQDCETLVCFIYNPQNKIKNPPSFISDFEDMSSDKLNVKVIIMPREY